MATNNSLFSDAEPIRKRSLVMIIVVDTSGSMEGTKIGSVNTALEELMPALAEVGEADAEIKVAVLTFSDVCEWMAPIPMAPSEIVLEPLVADGLTCLGTACKELSKRMSRKDLFQSPGSSYAPILILMSDGEPTDDFKEGLEELQKNNWFKSALKFALPIGPVADISALAAFTGNKESVLKAATKSSDLVKKIKMVALESAKFSTVLSQSTKENGSTISKQEMIIQNLVTETEDNEYNAGADLDDLGVDPDFDDEVWQ